MSASLPTRRRSADLFPVFPVTVVILAIAVVGCSLLEGAFRSAGALVAMLAVVVIVGSTIGFASLTDRA